MEPGQSYDCHSNGEVTLEGIINSFPPDKMGAFGGRYIQMHFHEWKLCILIKISLKFVPKGPINSTSALV